MLKGYRAWIIATVVLVIGILLSFLTGPGGFPFHRLEEIVTFRLPRIVIGVIAGGTLAVVGGAFQGIMRNPLVEPWTLGVASGAAVGVTMAIVLGLGSSVLLPVMAFLGAIGAIVAVYLLGRKGGAVTVTRLVLAGVIVSFFFSSLVIMLMIIGRRTLGEAIYLMMGTLGVVFTRNSFWLFVVSAAVALGACIWLTIHARELDIISLSEETALSLGVEVRRLTVMVFLIGSLAVAMIVAWTGAISFIGLVVPHLVRMMLGPGHRRLLPAAFIIGAGMLLFADVIARVVVAVGVPLSVITALVGVPFFIYLLQTKV